MRPDPVSMADQMSMEQTHIARVHVAYYQAVRKHGLSRLMAAALTIAYVAAMHSTPVPRD
jgi:hypothetical protein